MAESSARFRAVFSFGPVGAIAAYKTHPDLLPFDINDKQKTRVRSPIYWLKCVQSPLFLIEGTQGNAAQLQIMQRVCSNTQIHFLVVNGATHFNILAPVNKIIASKILSDNSTECNLNLTEAEMPKKFAE